MVRTYRVSIDGLEDATDDEILEEYTIRFGAPFELEDVSDDKILEEYTLRFGTPIDQNELYSLLLRGAVQDALVMLERHFPVAPSDTQRLMQYRRLMDRLPLGTGSAVRQ